MNNCRARRRFIHYFLAFASFCPMYKNSFAYGSVVTFLCHCAQENRQLVPNSHIHTPIVEKFFALCLTTLFSCNVKGW